MSGTVNGASNDGFETLSEYADYAIENVDSDKFNQIIEEKMEYKKYIVYALILRSKKIRLRLMNHIDVFSKKIYRYKMQIFQSKIDNVTTISDTLNLSLENLSIMEKFTLKDLLTDKPMEHMQKDMELDEYYISNMNHLNDQTSDLDKKIEEIRTYKKKLMDALQQIDKDFNKYISSVETCDIDAIKNSCKFFARIQKIMPS